VAESQYKSFVLISDAPGTRQRDQQCPTINGVVQLKYLHLDNRSPVYQQVVEEQIAIRARTGIGVEAVEPGTQNERQAEQTF
jgi:hypothetical protein